jgi:multimeric flavodoxin WrbA
MEGIIMKVLALNGSPRKSFNTALLLSEALEGASSQGAITELIHLYDLQFKGCISCFECKRLGGKSYGQCALKDDLKPILQKAAEADAILLGSPIYLGAVTGVMHALLERLIFQYLAYNADHSSLFERKIKTGFIYTLGAPEERMKQMDFDQPARINEMVLKVIFGSSETLLVNDTYQFDDYSKYETSGVNVDAKTQRRQEVFPADCQKAYEMGRRLAES